MSDLFALNSGNDDKQGPDLRPLAEKMRPQAIDQIVGQGHLTAVDAPLRRMIDGGSIGSMIFWGPPGCGKTTFARILAHHTDMHFEQLSAIFSGVKELRAVFDGAKMRAGQGRKTLLFIDEIHRFNKSQQDAFLPVMEDGTITLVGATTENPSFELNAALLSRAQVFVLKRLDEQALEGLIEKAEESLGRTIPLSDKARDLLITMADGDGRYLLTMVDQLCTQFSAADNSVLDEEGLMQAVQRRAAIYDKSDDAHYNMLSAFHKSLRGSDSDGALYWMARMLDGGEDPNTILRRMTCVASEDISNADPHALPLVIAAWQAYERLGDPEGHLAIAQAITYLASAPKSNASYMAMKKAKSLAKETGSLTPPKHGMNAPTKLMKSEGYSDGYKYDHDHEDGYAGQSFMPDEIGVQDLYQPVQRGFERDIQKRLEFFKKKRS